MKTQTRVVVIGGGLSLNVGAKAFLEPGLSASGTALEVEVIGVPTPATVVPPCLYDPGNLRLRG